MRVRNRGVFLNEMSDYEMAVILKSVVFDDGKAAHFAEHLIDHAGIQSTVAVDVGISKLIDFVLHFHNNARSSEKKDFPTYRSPVIQCLS